MAKLLWTDCTKETRVREKSGTVGQLDGRGESASSSVTDELSEETNLLLTTTSRDDDRLIPVTNFPRDIFIPVENLGEGIFGEVSVVLCCSLFHLFPVSKFMTLRSVCDCAYVC